ncbi:hypothetical protein BU17DRAFT_72703 [Hysterangium stoloniferum]|nr:hypothetical protein BU17DRAFT_72703 [Hysterangium stoloniferum]
MISREPNLPFLVLRLHHTPSTPEQDPCCNASTYKLYQLARKQHWVSDCSTRFVEIDLVADFERTSLGLARLGEWESKTTSSDMEPINNAMGVKSATITEGNEVEDAELDLGPQAHTSSGFSHPSIRITPHSHIRAHSDHSADIRMLFPDSRKDVYGYTFVVLRYGRCGGAAMPPACPRMSMELIALAFEGKVQKPVAEAYDPVEWKSFWLPISIFKVNGMPVPLVLSHMFHLSPILLLWTLRRFRRDTLVERKSFWGAAHYEQVL